MVGHRLAASALTVFFVSAAVSAQELIFVDGFESGDTSAWSQTVPPIGERGEVTGVIQVDHFGWRPGDTKVAIVLGHEGEAFELRRVPGNSVAGSFIASQLITDEDSGDGVALVDFSSLTAGGSYYLYHPAGDQRSYTFRIADDVYDIVGDAAVKSFYFQRCNHGRVLPYAGDALGDYPGLGGVWIDTACHGGDSSAAAGPGSPDYGPIDLHGGWHDAGDYQKTLWGRGVGHMLWAYELNPSTWSDNQLNLPEYDNGVPDLLDELAWELDFYLRMQRTDGHFMSSVKGNDATSISPPSTSNETRVYFDTTSPSGSGWSGGGVTLFTATANAVRALAHGSIVFDSVGQITTATHYRNAAMSGWTWLDAQPTPMSEAERHLLCASAAAVFRLDPTQSSAQNVVESFSWSDWDGGLPWSVTPGDSVLTQAAWHYLSNSSGDSAKKAEIRTAVSEAIVDRALAEAGVYGGLYGDPSNGWDWGWGSNSLQALYGANLLIAAQMGALGSNNEAEVVELAHRFLHYLLGLNPLNMVYLTNMAAYGGEQSSFQIYHGWFSHTGLDGDNGNVTYNGKPANVEEPLYPYYPDDDQISTYGPAPGLVPGGPNWYYGGSYDIPNRSYPAYAYRDWSVGCDWNGSECASASWEITEPMCAYQGAVVLLLSLVR
ncbi:MAG: hypothetical protein DRJ65_02685 [Acidobacteria bacterium]|nr:MAG: hypothetical protein DRJ65_02685 [Acidobacteriota bacterium]